jgi:hypothetical protein
MTDGISMARQRLRDYAREQEYVNLSATGWGSQLPPDASISVVRGEVGGKAFEAVQAALTVLEEQRAGHKPWEGDPASDTALILIDDIEAAILKALS